MRETGRQNRRSRVRRRKGALLSAEMLLVFPVVVALIFGTIEISVLISTYNSLKHASSVGCRVCSVTPGVCEDDVVLAVRSVLDQPDLVDSVEVVYEDTGMAGQICRVTLQMPMSEATPDLLGVLGVHLNGTLRASTAMRKE